MALVQACLHALPNTANVACFDSAFHHSLPDAVKYYAISRDVAGRKGLRKYGFHGLSYSYMTHTVAAFLGQPAAATSLIALHLGSGASACAIRDGESADTSMGLTPVSGLPGATRSGDIDPSLIFHYTSEASKIAASGPIHISRAEDILNRRSGWKALTGTADFAQIAADDAPAAHRLAFDMFVDRVVGYLGSYFVKLEGRLDALVFAGGIGEKSARLRRAVVDRCRCLGFGVDAVQNDRGLLPDERVVDISARTARFRTLVCQTDEEVSFRPHPHPPGRREEEGGGACERADTGFHHLIVGNGTRVLD